MTRLQTKVKLDSNSRTKIVLSVFSRPKIRFPSSKDSLQEDVIQPETQSIRCESCQYSDKHQFPPRTRRGPARDRGPKSIGVTRLQLVYYQPTVISVLSFLYLFILDFIVVMNEVLNSSEKFCLLNEEGMRTQSEQSTDSRSVLWKKLQDLNLHLRLSDLKIIFQTIPLHLCIQFVRFLSPLVKESETLLSNANSEVRFHNFVDS